MCASVCMCCECMCVHLCARDYMHARARMSALHVCIRVHVCACVVGVHVTLCACVSVCVHVTVYTCARACVLSARVSEYVCVRVCASVCVSAEAPPPRCRLQPGNRPRPTRPTWHLRLEGGFPSCAHFVGLSLSESPASGCVKASAVLPSTAEVLRGAAGWRWGSRQQEGVAGQAWPSPASAGMGAGGEAPLLGGGRPDVRSGLHFKETGFSLVKCSHVSSPTGWTGNGSKCAPCSLPVTAPLCVWSGLVSRLSCD